MRNKSGARGNGACTTGVVDEGASLAGDACAVGDGPAHEAAEEDFELAVFEREDEELFKVYSSM